MVKSCCDSYHTQFSDFSAMLNYHEHVRKSSLWERTEVKKLPGGGAGQDLSAV